MTTTVRIESNDYLQVYVNGTMIQNGQVANGGAPVQPSPSPGGAVPSITSAPAPFTDLGYENGDKRIVGVSPNSPVGCTFTVVDGAKNERLLRFEGSPGQFWTHNSWAIFNEGGTKVAGGDNVTVVGTLGYTFDSAVLMGLAGGRYTAAISCNAPGSLGVWWKQN